MGAKIVTLEYVAAMRAFQLFRVMASLVMAWGLASCSSGTGTGSLASAPEFPKEVYAKADCSDAQSSNPGIIGGQSVSAQSWLGETVVMLKHNIDGDGNGSFCTATLIDQNILITAAHCVSDESTRVAYDLSSLQVFMDANPLCDHDNFPKFSIEQVIIHPSWSNLSTGAADRGDIAMIRLSGVSPGSFRSSDLSASRIQVSSDLTSAGYGDNYFINDPYSSYRLKFVAPTLLTDAQTLRRLAAAELQEDFPGLATPATGISTADSDRTHQLASAGSGTSDNDLMLEVRRFDPKGNGEFLTIDQTQGKGICTGDSGGPLYETVSGQHLIVGIASFVLDPDQVGQPKAISQCAKYGVYSSVSHYSSWISSSFQQLKDSNSLRASPFVGLN